MRAFRRRLRTTLAAGLVAVLASACVADPGPPPTVEPTPTTETTEQTTPPTVEPSEPERSEVAVGVDELRNGLNPHLLADTSPLVDSIADLVLPSPFIGGAQNEDLVTFAAEVQDSLPGESQPEETVTADEDVSAAENAGTVVQTVRYEIHPEAQWSDGTPITGSDFIYLWEEITHTPGVIEPDGYRAIEEIRTANGGRTVEVDFSRRVANWQDLFNHLLPSHLADGGGTDFSTAFYATIGAGGSRFTIDSVDRARGVITLHRNDRFWGEDPAQIDILTLRTVYSVTQGLDLLRSGQIKYLDQLPSETMAQAYRLLPEAETTVVDGPRTLQLDYNVSSEILGEADARKELTSLLDIPVIARQAAGRTADLRVADNVPVAENAAPSEELVAATQDAPLRIGADLADEVASAAVRTIADLLARYDIEVEIVSTDIPSAARSTLVDGDLDALVTRTRDDGGLNYLASRYRCPPDEDSLRLANLTGYCTTSGDELSDEILAGAYGEEVARQRIAQLNDFEELTVPIMRESRVIVRKVEEVNVDNAERPEDTADPFAGGLSNAGAWRIPVEED